MKIVRLVLLAVLAVNFLACKPAADNTKKAEKVVLPVSLATISLDIEGMTCQIGCAKTIESRISKLEGVSESKVDFEKGKGVFVVDTNKTSKEVLIGTINSLVGGETYVAVESKHNACKVGCEKPCCATEQKTTDAKACEIKCSQEKEACSKACADKCDHKEGASCKEMSTEKKDTSCEVGCKKACCENK